MINGKIVLHTRVNNNNNINPVLVDLLTEVISNYKTINNKQTKSTYTSLQSYIHSYILTYVHTYRPVHR